MSFFPYSWDCAKPEEEPKINSYLLIFISDGKCISLLLLLPLMENFHMF
jgi:hypothetical protein